MAEPLRIRFATDTAGVKSAMQDVAASVVSNMVKVAGAVEEHADAAGAATKRLGESFGTGARGIGNAAATIVQDIRKIGAAGIKAANDTNYSVVGTANAVRLAAAETATGTALMGATTAAAGAQMSASMQRARVEARETGKVLLSSPIFRTVVAGVASYIAISAALSAIGAVARLAAEEVEKLVKIGERATAGGISNGFLQSMEGHVDRLQMKLGDIAKMFERLKKDSTVQLGDQNSESVNQSPLEKRLRELQSNGNVTTADVNGILGARDNEDRFKRLLELMDRLIDRGNVLSALDIGSRFMPPEMVDRIRENRVELEKLIQIANTPKKDVFSDEEIANAAELDRRMKAATETLQTGLRPIYEDLARRGRDFHASNVEWVEYLASKIPVIVSLYNNLTSAMQRSAQMSVAERSSGVFGAQQNSLPANLTDALTRAAKGQPQEQPAGPTEMDVAKDWIRKNMNPSMIALQQRRGQAIVDALNPPKDKGGKDTPSRGGSASEAQDQVESFIQSLERQTAAIKAEVEAYGKSNEEKQKAINLARGEEIAKQRGTALTEEEIRKLTAAGSAAGAAKDKLAELQMQTQRTNEAFRAFGETASDALYDMIVEGKSAGDVMKDLTKILIKAGLQAAIMGTGPLAGIFGTGAKASGDSGGLVGLLQAGVKMLPGFADGTDWAPGGLALVGERGPEVVRLPRGAGVTPNARLPSLSSGSGGGTVNIYLGSTEIDARGADPGMEARLHAGLDQRDRALRETLGAQFQDAAARGRLG